MLVIARRRMTRGGCGPRLGLCGRGRSVRPETQKTRPASAGRVSMRCEAADYEM